MDTVIRILDANFNRAREGLRVAEEAARFILADASIAARIKTLRHRLSVRMHMMIPRSRLCAARNTTTDTGRRGERFTFATVSQVAARNLLRTGEALRALEEYSRSIMPEACTWFHTARFELYDIERDLLARLQPPLPTPAIIIRITHTPGHDTPTWAGRVARCGADAIRLEAPGATDHQFLLAAARIQRRIPPACRLFMCGRPDIAVAVGARGVHLDRGDIPAAAVARYFPTLSVSVSAALARRRPPGGADYCDVGPLFSPDGICHADLLTTACKRITIPLIGTGGITPENGLQPIRLGASAIVIDSPHTSSAAFERALVALKRRLTTHGR